MLRTRWAAAFLIVALAGCTESGSLTSSDPSPPSSEVSTPAGASTAPPPAGPSSAPTPPPAGTTTPARPAPSATPAFAGVQLVRSGGIAGITETITIRPDGSWDRVTSKGVKAAGRTGAAELARLSKLAADPRLAAEAGRRQPTRGNCADTFAYLLIVGSRTIRYESCPGSGDKPAATVEMIALVQAAAK